MKDGFVITISRESYSGGEQFSKILADKLGYKFYDREIISMASEKSGIHEDHFKAAEHRPTNSILYSVVMGMYNANGTYVKLDDIFTDDKIYKAQADIIRQMSAEGNCVFVGRCSDYILRNNSKCINIFIRADINDRIARAMQESGADEQEAKKLVTRSDKKRRSYYNYYTNREWGDITNYDLSINLSKISEEKAVDMVVNLMESL